MTEKQLIPNTEATEERYNCYYPDVPVQIFHCLLDVQTVEDCEINIAKNCDLTTILPQLNSYLEWLAGCNEELTAYFQKKLGQPVPQNWFEEIEVFHFSITFDSVQNYGATISCGESVFVDHILTFDFEGFAITGDRM